MRLRLRLRSVSCLALGSLMGCGALLGLDFDAPAPQAANLDGSADAQPAPPLDATSDASNGGAPAHIVDLKTSRYGTAAVFSDGRVWAWGWNGSGELGLGNVSPQLVPALAAPFTTGAPLSRLALGDKHSCSVDSNGQVACVGNNTDNTLGRSDIAQSYVPVVVPLPPTERQIVSDTFIHINQHFSCVRRTDLNIWCWGKNSHGELGNGKTTPSPSPQLVVTPEIPDRPLWGSVATGLEHACAIQSTTSDAWCWGDNELGQLGVTPDSGPHEPVRVSGLTGVTKVVVGTAFSCALKRDATVVCWGDNNYGQFGTGDMSTTPALRPVQGLVNVKDIAAGAVHACALTNEGEVFCWGYNDEGQLGLGGNSSSTTKQRIKNVPKAAGIAAALKHTCMWTSDNAVYCWGYNSGGQLGTGDTENRLSPTRVVQNW